MAYLWIENKKGITDSELQVLEKFFGESNVCEEHENGNVTEVQFNPTKTKLDYEDEDGDVFSIDSEFKQGVWFIDFDDKILISLLKRKGIIDCLLTDEVFRKNLSELIKLKITKRWDV